MNRLEYLADRRRKAEKNKQKEIKSNKNKVEDHHPSARKNSKETIPLCKPCHDYITCVQNAYPVKVRTERELMALISLKGLIELTLKCLSEVIEAKITKMEN